MDKFEARAMIEMLTDHIITELPHNDMGILADLMIGAMVDEINKHIEDPDDYVVYDLF